MAFFKVPLNPFPETFSVTINNVDFNAVTRWNAVQQCWVASVQDANSVPILQNIPLIPGVDLLGQFAYLAPGVKLSTLVDYDAAAAPKYAELGTTANVYVETTA